MCIRDSYRTFTPSAAAEKNLATVFDQVIAWAGALKALRPPAGKNEQDRGHLAASA
ncbi:hypothetical protein [Arthrobacter sp. KBS0703]|uniref:hypothetical protein n=1 Tax=Arthrobacter sp. KBS0703 TaxID=1955698 RepID=UPI00163DAA0F|nr:hypothetical protein [Arthrobacter sp. KBS0703]